MTAFVIRYYCLFYYFVFKLNRLLLAVVNDLNLI